jgi:hypothetical protein
LFLLLSGGDIFPLENDDIPELNRRQTEKAFFCFANTPITSDLCTHRKNAFAAKVPLSRQIPDLLLEIWRFLMQ